MTPGIQEAKCPETANAAEEARFPEGKRHQRFSKMQVVCVGLLLFSVTWAAPTFQPQTVKTRQGHVEEQRIMYKGLHEKHGYYNFKYAYTSPGKKNQTDIKQEERSKGNIVLHHFDKRRNQQLTPKEIIIQEREKDFSLFEANENNQSSISPDLSANRQTLNEDHSISNKENARNDVMISVYPKPTGEKRVKDGDDAISNLHDQEEYGALLKRNDIQHTMKPGIVAELDGNENKEKKPRNVLSKIPVNYAKTHSKDEKNGQRDPPGQNIPVKSKSTRRHIRRNTQYLKKLPKVRKIPSDFEGSGYTELQERGDNDFSPFSGDGQPFKDIPGKGGAIGLDLESTDTQEGLSGPGEAESTDHDRRGPGYNEIPEREGHGGNAIGTRDDTAKDAGAAGVRLVEGGNDITGRTDFRELPGKEGNRVDAGSQNAHQGKVEFHYPHVPSKEKTKEGGRDATESANYNEIPKNGKGSSRKGTEQSNRNQMTLSEKQRFSSQDKSQGLLIPSHDLDNEINNEIGSHYGPDNERNVITHGRKNHYVPHGQNNSTRNKGMSQRRGPWHYRKPYSNRSFSPPKRDDSSESSESGSSSESDGD